MKKNLYFLFFALFALGFSYHVSAQTYYISTIAGTGVAGHLGDGGAATGAQLNNPHSVFTDASGNIYIADDFGNYIRKLSGGILTTIAGTGTASYTGDGGPATSATINGPFSVIVDATGNVYFSDYYNNVVRKINTSGTISTIAGGGVGLGEGGPATAAALNGPAGISFDGSGNLIIGLFNDQLVRKVNPLGIITTIAGNGIAGYIADGVPATSTELWNPNYVHAMSNGDVYITDNKNQRIRLVKASTGIITTVAGDGTPGGTGVGVPATSAELNYPGGVNFDAAGNMYISGDGTQNIRIVNPSGIINPYAGNGTLGFLDNVVATAGEMHTPVDVTFDANGNVIIADQQNNRVRIVKRDALPKFTNGERQTITACEDLPDTLNAYLPIQDSDVGQTETWTLLSVPLHGSINAGFGTVATGGVLYTTSSTGGIVTLPIPTVEVFYQPTTGFSGVDSFSVVISDGIAKDTTEIVVTVNAAPTAITGNFNVCEGGVSTLFDAVTGGTWSSGSTAIATVGSSSGRVTGVTVGGTATITYTTSCGNVTTTVTVNIAPVPYTGTLIVCTGSTTVLSDAVTGGTWSSLLTSVATVSSSGTVYGVAVGSASIQYNLGSGPAGCGIAQSVTVTSGAGVITPSSSAICVGGTIVLSDTAAAGGSWSSSSTSIAIVGPTTGSVTGMGPGTSTISFITSGGCTATKVVTVNGPSALSPALPTVCAGGTVALTDVASGGTWGSNTTSVATVTSGGIVTGATVGFTIISYSVNGCIAYDTVTVNSGAGVITPAGSTICTGQPFTLTDASTGGTWSSFSTSIAMVTASGGSVTGVSGGTTTITYSTGSCYATSTVSVIASSAISPLTSSLCVGSVETLTEASTSGIWASSNTSLATISSSGVVSASSLGTDTITYQIYIGASPVCAPYKAVVNVTSGAGTITPSGTVSVCTGATIALADAISGGVWSSGSTAQATISSSGVVSGVSAGTVTITYTVGICNTTKVLTATADPAAISPASIYLCTGSTNSLTDATTGGAWSSNSTGIATVASGTVYGVTAGTPIISYTVGSCSVTAPVTVYTTPVAIAPAGTVTICSGTTATLSDATTGGLWTSSGTAIATVSPTGTVYGVAAGGIAIYYTIGGCLAIESVVVTSGPGAISPSSATICSGTTLSLTEATSGGTWSSNATGIATVSSGGVVSGVAASMAIISYTLGSCTVTDIVNVAGTPSVITPSIPVIFCSASTTTLVESVTGGTWTSGSTGIATVTEGGIVTGVAAGTATISYNSGSCYITKTVTVSPGPVAILPASPTICTGNTLSLTDAVSGGSWSSSASGTATVGSTGTVGGVAAGTLNILYSIGSCVAIDAVTVVTAPTVGPIGGTTSLCAGSSTALTEAATSGLWSSTNTAAATVAATGSVYGSGVGTTTISYTITSSCGVMGAALVMTVNTSPSAGTITGVASMCSGTTAPLSNTVTGGSWYSSNGTASVNITTGLLTGISTGTDTITYTVTTPCGTASTTKVISIGAYLTAGTISGSAILCGGSTVHLTDLVTGGAWSSSNTSATVSSTGIVTGAPIGGMDTISYTVTAGCGSAVSTDIIDIYPSAISGSMTGVSTLCVGSSATFTESVGSGVWSARNSNAAVTGSGLVLGMAAGTDVISYTVTNSCGTSVATLNVTIGGAVSAGTISGAGSVCAGTPVTLTDAISGGVWSSSNMNASVSSAGLVSAIISGLDTILYTVTTSCGTATATFVISANSTALTAGTITGASGLCVGYPMSLSDAISGGVWSIRNTHASITSAGLVSGITTGMDTVTYTVSGSCGTATTSQVITIGTSSAGAGSISGTSVVCAGSTILLTDAVSGGAWNSSNTDATVISGIVSGVAAGIATISYSVTYSCGIAYAIKNITINPSAGSSSIAGGSTVCLGSTTILTDGISDGVWTSSNTNVSVSGGVVMGMALGTSTVSYSVSSGCGTSMTTSVITVVAGSALTVGPISSLSIVCVGSGITLVDPTTGGVWAASNGHAIVVGAGIIDGVSPGIDTISYSVSGICGSAAAIKVLNVDTIPIVSPITGPSTQCTGMTITLSDPTTGGVWTTSTPAVGTVTVFTGVVTGVTAGTTTITYTVTNLYGCPGTVILTDAVTPPGITTGITGSAGVCVGAAVTLSNATTGGIWSSGNTAVAVIDPVTGNVTGVSGGTATISYTVVNGCGTFTVTSIETVSALPTVSAISGPATGCVGSSVSLTDPTAGGVWSSSNTAVATVDGSGNVTGVASGPVTINYTVSSGCSVSAVSAMFINPAPSIAAISGTASQCIGSSTTLSDGTGGGVWSSSNTAIATVDGSGDVTGIIAGTVTISYMTTGGGCPGIATVTDIVNTIPVASPVTGTLHVCAGASTALGSSITGGVWSSSNTDIAVVNATSGVVTGVSGGTAELRYSISNACGSAQDSASVTVYSSPAVDPIAAAYTAVCTGDMLDVSDGISGGIWVSTNTSIASISSAGVVMGLGAGTDTIYYVVTNSHSCSSSAMLSITIGGAIASATVAPTGVVELCRGHIEYMHVLSSDGVSYQWLRNGSAIAGATDSSYTTTAIGNYAVVVSNGICSETVPGPSVIAPAIPIVSFISPDVLYTGTFASYQWFRNGVLIVGATGNILDETAGGIYTVVVTDANGCSDTSSGYAIAGGTGINGISAGQSIKVYPNPASSVVHIDAAAQVNVSVLSIDGKVLIEQKDATDVDVSSLADGLYMIMIYDQSGLLLKTAKFAKAE